MATKKTLLRNDRELNNLLYDAMANAIEYTMVKLFEENEDLIEKYVYGAYPELYYDRTKQFLDAWNYKVKKTSSHHMTSSISSRVYAEFYYDPNVMDYVPDKAQHGTPSGRAMDSVWGSDTNMWAWTAVQSAWGDAREYLADIIYQGKSGPLFGDGPWRNKRDAWTPLINKLDRGKIFTWFEEGMNNQHLKVYKR